MTNYNDFSELNKEDSVSEISVQEDSSVMGVVDCDLLNVRFAPSTDSNIVTDPIKKGTKVQIDYDGSSDMWLHVYLTSGVDGYVMRDYIVEENFD